MSDGGSNIKVSLATLTVYSLLDTRQPKMQ